MYDTLPPTSLPLAMAHMKEYKGYAIQLPAALVKMFYRRDEENQARF